MTKIEKIELIHTIKTALDNFTLLDKEDVLTNSTTFLLKETGQNLQIVICEDLNIVYTYSNQYFDEFELVKKQIHRDYQSKLIKNTRRYKNLINKIEKIIDKKIFFDDLDSHISFGVYNGDKISFNISNLRKFKIDSGNSNIYTDYFDCIFFNSQKELFHYLKNIYND